MGYISSLPSSMAKVKTIFESGENIEKFPIGPTSDRPGPTFERQVSGAVKLVTWS